MDDEPDTAAGRVEAFIRALEDEGTPRQTAEQIQAYLAGAEAEHPGTIAEMLALPGRLTEHAPLDTGRWEQQRDEWALTIGGSTIARIDRHGWFYAAAGFGDASVEISPDDLESAASIIRHQETKT